MLISTINKFDNHSTGMNDNISKTTLMMFHMPEKNVPSLKLSICKLTIEEVDHFNFLGLIIDKNMKWHTHVQKVANKIRNINGILLKL